MSQFSESISNSKHLWSLLKEAEKKLDGSMVQMENLIKERKDNLGEISKCRKRLKSDSTAVVESFGFISSSVIKGDAGYSKKISKLAKAVCKESGLSNQETMRTEIISRLHLMGLLFSKNLKDEFIFNPDKASFIFDKFSFLKNLTPLFLQLDEKFDGSGPLSKKGKNISIEIRIFRGAAFYYHLYDRGHTVNQITAMLDANSGNSLDPNIVSNLYKVLIRKDFFTDSDVRTIGLKDLMPGFKLVTGIFSTKGAMLLPAGTIMNDKLINKIVSYNEGEAVVNTILIRR